MFECPRDCLRCDEAPATCAGFCDHCDWQIRLEAEFGLMELASFLKRWAEFSAWESS